MLVTGTHFPKNSTGYLVFDGDASAMSEYRASRSGDFQASFVVPLSATVGEHMVSAMPAVPRNSGNLKRAAAAGAVAVATVMLAVAVGQHLWRSQADPRSVCR